MQCPTGSTEESSDGAEVFWSGVDGQGDEVRAGKRGILLRAPEEWMEKGANKTTPPDVAGAAKTKRTKGSLV